MSANKYIPECRNCGDQTPLKNASVIYLVALIDAVPSDIS